MFVFIYCSEELPQINHCFLQVAILMGTYHFMTVVGIFWYISQMQLLVFVCATLFSVLFSA